MHRPPPFLRIFTCVSLLLLPLGSAAGQTPSDTSTSAKDVFLMDAVHQNPGEPPLETAFSNPEKLARYGYDAQVINDFTFVHAAVTFDSLRKTIFPRGSKSRAWVQKTTRKIQREIRDAHDAGLKIYFWMDLVVLPKRLVKLYGDQIKDEDGNISFARPKTREIHREMLDELFARFPGIDGLVIRTGETYLHDVPYHTGGDPIVNGRASHKRILHLLRQKVAVEHDRKLFYRTWGFDGFHTDPDYYLDVTNDIKPHENLIFSIKHTKGDFQRTYPFNPTIGIGKHKQIVEVECQREYEGKGAHPDYIADGVLNGFSEFRYASPPNGLNDVKDDPQFMGVWTWSRGGGWDGPQIENELWADLNAYAMSRWANDPSISNGDILKSYARKLGLQGKNVDYFRKLAMLSPEGVLKGRNSDLFPVNVWWIRDAFMGGLLNPKSNKFGKLNGTFKHLYEKDLIDVALREKEEAVAIWKEMVALAERIRGFDDAKMKNYVDVSTKYGLYKYAIIYQAWRVMLRGYAGDRSGHYDKSAIRDAIHHYDQLWEDFRTFKANHPSSASLYEPYAFVYDPPTFHGEAGMKQTVNRYREKVGLTSR